MAVTVLPSYAAQGVARGEQTANNVLALAMQRDKQTQTAALEMAKLAMEARKLGDQEASDYWKARSAQLNASVGNTRLGRDGKVIRTNTISGRTFMDPDLQRENYLKRVEDKVSAQADANAVPPDMFKDAGIYDKVALQDWAKLSLAERDAMLRANPMGPRTKEDAAYIDWLEQQAAAKGGLAKKIYGPAANAWIQSGDSRVFDPRNWTYVGGERRYIPTYIEDPDEDNDLFSQLFDEKGDYSLGQKDEDAWKARGQNVRDIMRLMTLREMFEKQQQNKGGK